MKKIISKKIITLILLEAFLFSNNAWAGTTLYLQTADTDCLSPSIKLKSLDLEKVFWQLAQNKQLQDSIAENQIVPKIDKEKLATVLNRAFGKEAKTIIFTAGKLERETVPVKIKFNWRWDPRTETRTKRTAVITAEATEVDFSNLYLDSLINKGRYPRVMTMLVYFDKDSVEISHLEVHPAAQRRGIANIALKQLKILADEFSEGRLRIVHSVNRTTLDILHKIAIEKGQDIEEVKEHILRYPQIYNKGKIDTQQMFQIIGRDILLSGDLKQEEMRERFITSLIHALEAMERNGIAVMAQKEINDSPLIKILQKSGYQNVRIVFGTYDFESIDEATKEKKIEQMKDIQIHAETGTKRANNTLESRLKLPDEELVKKVTDSIKKKFPQWNILSIYLYGSALWKEEPGDWDLIVFIDNKEAEGIIDGMRLAGTPDVHYTMVNLSRFEQKDFRSPWWDFTATAYISGKPIYGKDVIKDIIGGFGITLLDLLEFAGFSIEESYKHSDHLKPTLGLDEKTKKMFFKDEKDMHDFLEAKMKKSIKSFFNALLIVNEVIKKSGLQIKFYSLEDIFALRSKADNYYLELDSEENWQDLQKISDYWNKELEFLNAEREKLEMFLERLKEICVLKQKAEQIDSTIKDKLSSQQQSLLLIERAI